MSFSSPLIFSAFMISILVSLPVLEVYSVTPPLKINEVEFDPPGPDTNNQWIELCNKSPDLVNIGGWLIKSTKLNKTFKVPDGFVIAPNDYLVIPFNDVMFAHQNESVVMLTPDSVEVDRTQQLSDAFDDDRTWQRFPDCSDTWAFRNSTHGITNGFPVAKSNFTLSEPILVDQKGNKVDAFNAGQMAGIKSEIVNQSTEERTFAYIVQIKNEQGFPVFISWVEDLTILPERAIKPTVFWLAEEKGTFQVEVFVWRSLANPQVLTPEQSGLVRVAG